MKATGIVRRIDDLGRVVVPKEIRRTLRIREGDPLEIFTDREGEIILKKYSPIGELSIFAKQYAEAMAQTTGLVAVIADRDQFIAVAGGGKKDLLAKAVSKELEELMTGQFLRGDIAPPKVEDLIRVHIVPIRPGRSTPRRTKNIKFNGFFYRIA